MSGDDAGLPDAVRLVRPLSGGQVASVWLVDGPNGAGVLKRQPGCPVDFFRCEADGLAALGSCGGLRTPEVWGVGDDFLLMEFVEPDFPSDSAEFRERFAAGLARQHRNAGPAFGWQVDHYLGSQPQAGGWSTDWVAVYRDFRLVPQMERADRHGRMSGLRRARLMRVLDRLPQLLAGMDEPPALIHGDLWSGNFLCTRSGEPVLIDPAAHYAPREMELAYVELFGGFPEGFVDAYHREYPLLSGYAIRRAVHQLYPLLIHVNHFGETYGPMLDGALDSIEEGMR